MGLPQEDNTPVYEDNTACIKCGNHIIGGREHAKHIDIRKHFAHEVIHNGHMRLIRVPTEEQLANILLPRRERRTYITTKFNRKLRWNVFKG